MEYTLRANIYDLKNPKGFSERIWVRVSIGQFASETSYAFKTKDDNY
jgi:hypothetical protein